DVAFGPVNLHCDEERARTEAEEALEAVGYTGDYFTPCNALSLGEMRKVALAGVLVLRPDILLLDEPDSYLDREGKERLLRILHSLEGITRILVTHDVEFASELCHQGLYLEKGAIGFHGPLRELIEEL
ncbi:MAG TPA: energy-coupling factor ABC transporter ATP-binding protein, partial [bacterium]|nr:energy-coupling factor ABC transporter ATP-binding protein [bacterium]